MTLLQGRQKKRRLATVPEDRESDWGLAPELLDTLSYDSSKLASEDHPWARGPEPALGAQPGPWRT